MNGNPAEEKTDLTEWLRMVEQLRHAPEWPEDEKPIEMIQTHISVLLLSRTRVVKLKKPVNFGFLDYTTLEKRRQACWNEIQLNRRLCPDMYIGYGGVIDTDGKIGFSGRHGKIVDHCLWMNRLPADRMLDHLVETNDVTEKMIDGIAAHLAEFHRNGRRGVAVSYWASVEQINHNWEENFKQAEPFVGQTLNATDYTMIRRFVQQQLVEQAPLFEQRIRDQRIVDGHGDVRCESICVNNEEIYIYDCIEFNEGFRCGDVTSEIAFLSMDLAARGRADLGYFLSEAYQRRCGDSEFYKLLPFYRCYRAFVRGKVLSFQLNEAEISPTDQQTAAKRAADYFEWARRYATPLRQPTVVMVCGLSGSGKTSVARALAEEFGMRVVSSDAVRQALFGAAKRATTYNTEAYTPEANRRTYEQMLNDARKLLIEGNNVILDATFRRAEDRTAAHLFAHNLAWRVIECRLPVAQTRARLAARAPNASGLSDATWETYSCQRQEFAPLTDADGALRLALDTQGARTEVQKAAADWLRANDQT